MRKNNKSTRLRLDALMNSSDPKIRAFYGQMVAEEGVRNLDRALLRTAVYFKNYLPKQMHAPLARECRKAGIAVA